MSIEEVAAKDVPSGTPYEIVEDDAIPQDRTFRNAWEFSPAKTIQTNFVGAQRITKERLRVERKPLLEAQDVLFVRAIEAGAVTAPIAQEKQRLRDITNLADAATSLEQLKSLKC
jgi:hypothetical protein